MWQFGQDAGTWQPFPAIPDGAELVREEPARAPSLVGDLAVPLVQALATGILLGGLLAFVAARLGARNWPSLWAGLTLAISAGAWLVLLGQTRRLLWTIERVTGRDLDGDKVAGKPPAERLIVVNAGEAQEEGAAREQDDRRSAFAAFVAGLELRGTDARTWEPLIGRPAYKEYRDLLIRLKWARWRSLDREGRPNERRGWELARPAAEILAKVSG